MRKITSKKKSQALLDFILIFGALLALLVGFTRIWVWFNSNFAKRNVDYQNTRLAAGTADNTHFSGPSYSDSVLTIDDEWVFRGNASGSVGSPPSSTTVIDVLSGEGGSSGSACTSATATATALRTQADNMDEQADEMEDFIRWGDEWYKPLFFVFMALNIDVDEYEDAIDDLRDAADTTRTSATSIQEAACS